MVSDPGGQSLELGQSIRAQIRAAGPMSVATYMRLCLTHPRQGYYVKADPLGANGDFVTAPEISQMFGELIGAWVLMHWHVIGKPAAFDLVELGPGRGTLMADALRVISRDPEARDALRLVLLETSPALIEMQRDKLGGFNPKWIREIGELENGGRPLIIVANEFFDALPVKQVQRANGQWHERLIGLDGEKLVWGLSETPLPDASLPAAIQDAEDNEIFEFSPLARETVTQIATLLNRRGGGMIAIDYGHVSTRTGDTFQAVAGHAYADPLAAPGQADLTAHVDFEALINAARETGAHAQMAGTQAEVLRELGIGARTEKLAQANPDRAGEFRAARDRLTGDDQMGTLFKVMAVFGNGVPVPFESDETLAGLPGVRHGFFGRQGGQSTGTFASLNVSYMTGGDPDIVAANRATAAGALGFAADRLATVKQIHSDRVIILDDGYDPATLQEADGLVSNRPGWALGILTADCTPILFADPQARVIGACHAGWRGAVSGIIGNSVAAMQALGADPARITAAIGPVIFGEDYEVGSEFAANVVTQYPDAAGRIFKPAPDAREHFDLPGFVHDRLKAAGITRIAQVGQSTPARPDLYYSHRYATAHGIDEGRQISIIGLTG